MLGSRKTAHDLSQHMWDILVVGGGITGAGIALESAKLGKSCLLLEQQDFAWGTSSRSSKMVHGGLRYIAQGHIKLTKNSLLERERLLQELPTLVKRQPYTFVIRSGEFPGRWPMKMVLWLYDFLAGIKDHRWLSRDVLLARIKGLSSHKLKGAMYYTDALTDDSRLVLRVLHEATAYGAQVNNYIKVQKITPLSAGFEVLITDVLTGETSTIHSKHVINATGAWADKLSATQPKIRPLRGSHILIGRDTLRVDDSITFLHPKDKRPVFIYPWLGVTCVGTTDLDHTEDMDTEPRCSVQELSYLLDGVKSQFPHVSINASDVISSMAGVRPVVASGKGLNPSQESREHSVWVHHGIVSVSGGKLTTFRLIALDTLQVAGVISAEACLQLRQMQHKLFNKPIIFPEGLGHPTDPVVQGEALLESLTWILQQEMVVHLDDLLLRRIRLGNVLPNGGAEILPSIKALCMQYLAWDETRWESEVVRYMNIIKQYYSPQASL